MKNGRNEEGAAAAAAAAEKSRTAQQCAAGVEGGLKAEGLQGRAVKKMTAAQRVFLGMTLPPLLLLLQLQPLLLLLLLLVLLKLRLLLLEQLALLLPLLLPPPLLACYSFPFEGLRRLPLTSPLPLLPSHLPVWRMVILAPLLLWEWWWQ
jgi:hypothetical protein